MQKRVIYYYWIEAKRKFKTLVEEKNHSVRNHNEIAVTF